MQDPRSQTTPARDFRALFGAAPAVRDSAPGRVNLIGEHTDYNGGFVLPVALPQRARVELLPRPGTAVRAYSEDLPGPSGEPLRYELGAEARGRCWLDYVQGVTQALLRDGHLLTGFDLWVRSDVPLGAGLSSSAALEVALLRALRGAFGLALDDVALARYGQRAENELVGAAVGIMDQMAASLGQPGSCLFLDTRSLRFERVPLPPAAELVVLHSGIAHSNVGGAYAERRAQCEQAAALLGVQQLRDVSARDRRIEDLPEPLRRRARHVVSEDARVLQAVEALRAGDLRALGDLLNASHASLRDDFQVSLPRLDLLVDLLQAEPDIYGARLTGGGFGGSVVALARRGAGAQVAGRVGEFYQGRTGLRATTVLPIMKQDQAGGLASGAEPDRSEAEA